jgi:hypothetical protein
MITRQAPAWAWEIIDETLASEADSKSSHRGAALNDALAAMYETGEEPAPRGLTARMLISMLQGLPPDTLIFAHDGNRRTIVGLDHWDAYHADLNLGG